MKKLKLELNSSFFLNDFLRLITDQLKEEQKIIHNISFLASKQNLEKQKKYFKRKQ